MTEVKNEKILYGIVQVSDLEVASMKHLEVKIDGKFIDHEYLPSSAGEFSTEKEHLIAKCRSSKVHYVVPIKTNIRCFEALALSYNKSASAPYDRINISLDYDGTVTSDYFAFSKLVELFKSRGHRVYIVTMRYESECRQDANFMRLTEMVDGWCPTGRMAKRKYCEQQGLKIHIWIDDNPIAVEKDAINIWGTVSPEGSVVVEEHGTKVTNGE